MTFDLVKLHSLISLSMEKAHKTKTLPDVNVIIDPVKENLPESFGNNEDDKTLETNLPVPHNSGEILNSVKSSVLNQTETTNYKETRDHPCSVSCQTDNSEKTNNAEPVLEENGGNEYEKCFYNSDFNDSMSESKIETNVNNLITLLFWTIQQIGLNEKEIFLCREILVTLINILNRTVEIMKQETHCHLPIVCEIINPDDEPIVTFKYFRPSKEITSMLKVIKNESDWLEFSNMKSSDGKIYQENAIFDLDNKTEMLITVDGYLLEMSPEKDILLPEDNRIADDENEPRTDTSKSASEIWKRSPNRMQILPSWNEEFSEPHTNSSQSNSKIINATVRSARSILINNRLCKNSALKPYGCSLCKKSFARSIALKMHAFSHIKLRWFQCLICYKRYSSINLLRNHLFLHKSHTKKSSRDKKFVKNIHKRNRVQKRVKTNLLNSDRRHIDARTTFRSANKVTYFNHSKILQNVIRANGSSKNKIAHDCKFCLKTFQSPRHLQQHEMIHFTSPKTHKCTTCNKNFTTNCDLQKHKSTHAGETSHSCSLCDQQRISYESCLNISREILPAVSSCRKSINIHRLMTGRLHTCNLCSKTFTTACELQSHKHSHEKGTRLSCGKCVKTRMSMLNIR